MQKQATTMRQRTQEIALMIAAAAIPRSFQRSLLARSAADQGIITGLSVVMIYYLGLLTQDTVETGAKAFGVTEPDETEGNTLSTGVVVASIAAIGIGLLAEHLLPYDKNEKTSRSALRTSGMWLRNTGIAGLMHSAVTGVNEVASRNDKKANQRDLLPYLIGVAMAYSLAVEYAKVRSDESYQPMKALVDSKPLRAIGVGAGVAAALAGLVYTERTVARKVDAALDTVAPKLKKNWLPVGHAVGAGAIFGGFYLLLRQVYGKIEHQAGLLETGFTEPPTSTKVSGGPDSLVSWDSLSVQGRRHVGTSLSKTQIESVMSEEAMDPIRVYVGLDSADTEKSRIELAVSELERMGAFERDAILVVSPTGTGYVNYVMSEAVEYLARGNVASVTMQYSKRPSPMSLDRVDEGHIQYRLLLNAIRKKLAALPPKTHRPRILLFGESLGAWTSQDAFMHEGTDGMRALNVDRALWIGTPKGSKWKEQLLSGSSLNTEQELVGVFDSYADVERLDPIDRAQIRYVLLTHNNDPIAQFGLSLLFKQPEWVTDESKRPEGMSSSIRYRTPTLFVQTLIDMKNALKPEPGKFVASAHDYRADLANFVAFALGYTASDEQMIAIETALRENEVRREERIKYGQ